MNKLELRIFNAVYGKNASEEVRKAHEPFIENFAQQIEKDLLELIGGEEPYKFYGETPLDDETPDIDARNRLRTELRQIIKEYCKG